MCNKLLQAYACGHSKSICTTPCTHALKFSRLPAALNTPTQTITRSSSTNFSRLNAHHPPLRVINTPAQTSPTHVPDLRFAAPSAPSPVSPASPVSLSFDSDRSQASTPPSSFPSPAHSTVEAQLEPMLCSYYIPRYLVTSKYPCVECYRGPEWKGLREKWMETYRLGHPLDKVEDVEVLSGGWWVMQEGALS